MTRTRVTLVLLVTILVAISEEATRPLRVARAASFNAACSVDSLKTAITDANAASGPDVIELAPSCIYTLTSVDNTEFGGDNGLPIITGDLEIVGNGATIRRSSDNGTPDFRILRATEADLTVRDLSIQNGRLSESDFVLGAGIRGGQALVIENSSIAGNRLVGEGIIADARGAGSFSSGPSTITNSSYDQNIATAVSTGQGGGAFAFGTLTISGSSFSLNEVTGTTALGGGAGTASSATITNSTFGKNGATGSNAGSGGAVHAMTGMTVTGSTFGTNKAEGQGLGAFGGAVRSDGTLSVTGSTFAGNVASGQDGAQGGGTWASGTTTVEASTIESNSAVSSAGPGEGGGIYAFDALTATNATISGNSAIGLGATVGGGSFSRLSTTLVHVTYTANTAPGGGNGGGVYSNTTMSASNSIFAANIGGDCAAFAAITADATSIDTDGSCGSAATVGDAKLLPLATNPPGATKTHALESDSPAVGIGASCSATDQRGVSRPADGCDAGAYELVEGFHPFDVDCDGDEDLLDALAVMNVLAGNGAAPQPGGACDADVDNDNNVDLADVTAIRRYIAGL